LPQFTDNIWLPGSAYDKHITSLNRALRQYDERLEFGRNMDNGDWCVFVRAERDQLIPVLGFQNEVPTIEEMLERVQAADTKRHGDRILKSINDHNEQLKQEKRDAAEEGEWQLAEAMESFLHAQGKTPYYRSLNKAYESKKRRGKSASG
jgi:hypothetical protein